MALMLRAREVRVPIGHFPKGAQICKIGINVRANHADHRRTLTRSNVFLLPSIHPLLALALASALMTPLVARVWRRSKDDGWQAKSSVWKPIRQIATNERNRGAE
jgi:hypothetical protein